MFVQWWGCYVGQVILSLYVVRVRVRVYRCVVFGILRIVWALVVWGHCGRWGLVDRSPRVGWDGTPPRRGIHA